MDQNYRAFISRTHFGDLDGLRFLCIALVLWHHCNPLLASEVRIVQRGFLGVDFFFVLSGFLITTLILREIRRDGDFSLLGFYRRRALRILPPYYLLVTAVSAYFILAKGEVQWSELVPYYYLFLSNFLTEHIPLLGITWSLSVEEQYYALWPLLIVLLPRAAIVPVLLVLIAANVLVSGGLIPADPISIPPLLLSLPNATFAPILMGSLAAWMLDRPQGYAALDRLTGWKGASLFLLALVFLLFQATPPDVRGWPNLVIHGSMTLALVALVIRPANMLSPLFRWKPVARVGRVSYGIYLYHLIALHIAQGLFGVLGLESTWALLLSYSLLSIMLAEISFRYYESRFLELRYKPAQGAPA